MLSLRNQVLRQEGVNSVLRKGGADEVSRGVDSIHLIYKS